MEFTNININDDERLDFVNENLSIIQKKNGLTFGTDAYLLAAYVRAYKNQRAVELGGGTGIISLLLAVKNKCSAVYSVEIQSAFADIIRRNAEMNQLSNKVFAIESDIRNLNPTMTDGEVDIAVSNPPYMKLGGGKENNFSEKNIARREICGGIYDFCSAASKMIKYGGSFYTVYRPERLIDLISALRENSLEPKKMTFVFPDENSVPCLVLIQSKKGGNSGIDVTPPLIIYKNQGERRDYSDNMNKIYDTCSFESIF